MFAFRPWPRRSLTRHPFIKPGHSNKPGQRRRGTKPRLEILEERWVPATYDSFFELDGNILSQGATNRDWDKIYSDFHTGTALSGTGALNFYNDLVPVTVPFAAPDPLPSSEDTLTGGNSKDIYDMNLWTYGSSAPQNKANLENAIAAAYLDPANGHTYLYVGATRFDNSGSTTIGVWFLQSPVGQSGGRFYQLKNDGSIDLTAPAQHQNGDLLLVANFGSGAASFTSFTWNNGGIPAVGTTLDPTIGKAMVNAQALDGSGDRTPVPWPYRSSARGSAANYVQANQFFEAGVDLNLLFGPGVYNFSSFIVETRSSTSPSATLSDIIVGHVSTAPDVTVSVTADATPVDAGSQVGMIVTVENVGVGDLANVTLTGALPAGANGDIVWSEAPGSDPNDQFVITGAPGSQTLAMQPNLSLPFNSGPISVHLIATSTSSPSSNYLLSYTATVAATNEILGGGQPNVASTSIQVVSSGIQVSNQSSVEGESHLFDMGTLTSSSSGTASVVVNWGDGSSNSTFNIVNTPNVALPLTDQSHTYWEQGNYTVTISVTLGGSTKVGTFTAAVSNPAVLANALSIPTQTYDGLAVGSMNLATYTDPGGAEGVNLNTHYTATINWGGAFGTSAGTISFAGSENSFTDAFTISGSIPYVNVGTYHPTIMIDHEGTPTGPVNLTVVIDPAPLTITADAIPGTGANDAFSKVYDGQVYTGFTVRYNGFVNGETASVLGGVLGFSGTGTTATNAGGPYTVTPGGLTSGNYSISFVNGVLNINRAPLTITADSNPATGTNDAFSKVYDGQVYSGFTVRYDGFVNGESVAALGGALSFSGAGTTAVNAGGPYAVTPAGLTSTNYNIGFVSGSLTISRAHLTVSADNDAINEGVNPSGQLSATISGFVNGESAAVVSGSPVLTTTATGTSAPGNYSIVVADISGLTATNYDFAVGANGTLTVVDVAPTIVMSTGTIRLTPGDGFTRNGSYTDPGIVVPSETWTLAIDYGDGATTNGSSTPGSYGLNHSYAATGTYTVTVTISDNYGASSQRVFTVNVAPLPTLDLYNNGNLIGASASGTRNSAFSLDCHFTQATSGTGSFTINWGDPAGDKANNPNVQSGSASGSSGDFSRSHVYRHAGTYTVSVTFTDEDGDSITKTFLLTIV